MKKLIFLFIMAVFLIGMMPAQEAAHPSGVITPGVTLSGYSAHEAAVTPVTVPVVVRLFELPAGYLVLPELNDAIRQPQVNRLIKPIEIGKAAVITGNEPAYWPRP
jgi:hypothetical protein